VSRLAAMLLLRIGKQERLPELAVEPAAA